MTRLVLTFAFVAATSGVAFADDAPSDGGTQAAPATAAPPKPKYRNIPPYQFQQAKLSGDDPHLPDDVKLRYKGAGQVSNIYKICVAPSGDVSSVHPMQSIPGGDEAIMATLRTWKFKPQAEGGICSMSRFVFLIH
jgi:hypothetical protein